MSVDVPGVSTHCLRPRETRASVEAHKIFVSEFRIMKLLQFINVTPL